MALADALQGLLRLPGATYACVVERDSGRVRAEAGRGEGGAGDGEGVVPYSVARWGTAVAAMFDATSGDDLDDVMLTGRRSYHLVRPLGPGGSMLVYLRLDRVRANLAAARRELAAVRWGVGGSSGSAEPPGAHPSRAAPERPSARAVPESPSRAVPESVPESPSPAAPESPSPAAARVPAAMPPMSAAAPGRSRPARAVPAMFPTTPWAAGSRVAAMRPAVEAAPRIPLPRRAPGRQADATHHRSGPRRATAADEGSEAPEGFAMPSVLGQSWARDPGTLRRLLAGLRRMS